MTAQPTFNERQYARALREARAAGVGASRAAAREQTQRQRYLQGLGADIASGKITAAAKNKNTEKLIETGVANKETRQILQDTRRIVGSSKVTMPAHVVRAAVHARAALKDFRSKWWIVGFAVAFFKDTLGDITWILGVLAQVFLIIFLFGGGFFRKYLKRYLWKYFFVMIIGFIPVLNIVIPDAVIAVFVRWNDSRKEYYKAKKTLENINATYGESEA